MLNHGFRTIIIHNITSPKSKATLFSISILPARWATRIGYDNIVRFNNTQNSITTWDKFSNDEDQKRIDGEFKELGFSYNRKRGFSVAGEQIGIEQVIQPLLAYHGRSTDAVRGKNQLFVQKLLYQNAFEGTKARHILFVYTLSRAIDTKRLAFKAKSSSTGLIAVEEKQMTLLRNLNFKPFFINVIANTTPPKH